MTSFYTLIDRLLHKETVLTANLGAIGDTSSQFVQKTILTNPDGPEAAGVIQSLRDALGRVARNFDLLLAGKPVRDVAEMKAEIAAALAKGQ